MEATVRKNCLGDNEVVLREFNRVVVVRLCDDRLKAEIWNALAYDGDVDGGCAQTVWEGDYDDWTVAKYFEVACQLLSVNV